MKVFLGKYFNMENICSIIFSPDYFSSDRIHLVCYSLICMYAQMQTENKFIWKLIDAKYCELYNRLRGFLSSCCTYP